VQYRIAQTTRACSYDRAGLGFSDEGPLPRDAAAEEADLEALLQKSGVRAPYVLVAHSLGSYIVRLFADLNPDKVAGLVLVDPSVEHQASRLIAAAPAARRFFADNPEPLRKCLAAAENGALTPTAELYKMCVPVPPPSFPQSVTAALMERSAAPGTFRTMLSEKAMMEGQSSEQVIAARRSYGAVPLIVLTAGEPSAPASLPEPDRRAINALWGQMHDELAALSSRGENRTVQGAGHNMHLQQPQAVVDAVNQVVVEARQSTRTSRSIQKAR
jgi:pimeloyl-ACP methyl ester carboxylesterase